jgi:mannitol-specific phosphotransferase system IIBC component
MDAVGIVYFLGCLIVPPIGLWILHRIDTRTERWWRKIVKEIEKQ